MALTAGADIGLPLLADELAFYGVDGDPEVAGVAVAAHTLALLEPCRPVRFHSSSAARCAIVSGAAVGPPRRICWKFASSRKGRIEKAAADWQQKKNGAGCGL